MKKISLNSVKSYLSRDEMRVISGGSGGYAAMGKCCWDNYPGSCSVCVWTEGPCTSGSHLVAC